MGGLRRSALARRNICPLRRKMSLLASSLSHELLSMGCQRAYPQPSASGIPRGTRTTNPKVRSNNLGHSGYVVYDEYVVFLVLISLQHSKKTNSMASLYTMKSYCSFSIDNVRDSHFACLPGDDLLFQGLCPKYHRPWNERRMSLSPHGVL